MKEEEAPLPSYLFKVRAEARQIGACLLTAEHSSVGCGRETTPGVSEGAVAAEGDEEASRLQW